MPAALAAAALRQDFLRQCAPRYWAGKEADIAQSCPEQAVMPAAEPLPPALAEILLPEWASDLGIAGKILVPAYCTQNADWQRTDWLLAGAWHLHSLAERAFERANGPIHSYPCRLQGWDGRIWQFAWANRIALFLRRRAAHEQGLSDEELFGPLPDADIRLSFDVDAIRLTLPIRLKQCAFNLFNVLRRCKHKQWKEAARCLGKAVRFLVGPREEWPIAEIMQQCEKRKIQAVFNFPGLPAPSLFSEPKRWLFDPGYDVAEIQEHIRALAKAGHCLGVHPSFEHWDRAEPMATARQHMAKAANAPVTWCRQHWLRFSYAKTWKAQQAAGIATDCTLGFNDRLGFRNGAALAFAPWDAETNKAMDDFSAWPLVLMDSHVYDYQSYSEAERARQLEGVLEEIRFVHGQATVLWHPHTLGKTYGWADGFMYILRIFNRNKNT